MANLMLGTIDEKNIKLDESANKMLGDFPVAQPVAVLNIGGYICPFCSKHYKHDSSLSRHKRTCPNNILETKTVNLKYLQALVEFAKNARDENFELKQRIKELQEIVKKYSS